LAFGLAGRAAHQGCSTFCCAGTGDGTGAAVAFDAANAAVTAAPALMNSRRASLDSGKGAWDFFIFVLLKIRRENVIVRFVAAQMPGLNIAGISGSFAKLARNRFTHRITFTPALNRLPKNLPASFGGIKPAALQTAGDASKLSADRRIHFG
jgi:hypothetical protein